RVEDEGWRLRKDGSRFWANVVITALYDEAGVLRGFGKVTRDMTERRAAEQALRESEERFRLLVQNVLDYAIFMLDPEGRVQSWNAGAQRIKGYSADEIIGRHFSTFYPPDVVAAGYPAEELVIAARDGRVEDEGWRLRKDGSRFWANVVITALYDEAGVLRGFGKVTRDMTERRHAQQTLDERRQLLAHLVEAQEAERRRIAWDIHDDSIQSMVAVGMRLQLLERNMRGGHAEAVRKLDETVRGTIGRLRDLVYRLRPPAIDRETGLVNSLAAYLGQVVGESGMTHALRVDLEHEPPRETAIMVFRIAQEALTNVRKHARATRVEISLVSVRNGLHVKVRDDGVGIDGDAHLRHDHFGLVEMRERAEIAGGWWNMTSAPGSGTEVEFWVPVAPASSSAVSA
ncbi:PAS domain S-box protein, partial [Micromonospora sp. NPDC049679]|uniref:PAS domain-containing sensor histidine kinase n=1 Tax=Micromonospora sp. NPDC049679 TaxID=3155920 RepID=UPI0033CF9280